MKIKKLQIEDAFVLFLMILYLYHQYFFIIFGGTVFDDLDHINTSKRIIDKSILFFQDSNNPFLSEFNASNYEFYGYIVAIPVFLFSNNQYIMSIFLNLLVDNPNVDINNIEEFGYIVRYNTINIYVVMVLILTYRLLNNFYSKRNSFLIILFLIMIPSFNGQALFNIKDIPFALQLFLATLYLLFIEKKKGGIKSASVKEKIITMLLISSVLLVRLNGIVFIGLISLYLLAASKQKINYIISYFYLYFGSFILFFLGSPSSWQKPRLYLTEVIKTQFFLEWTGATLTNGKYIYAMNMEPEYLLTWFFYRLPIVFHISLIVGTIVYFTSRNKSEIFKISMFYIYAINFVFILFLPASYDGIRQYIFLLPFFSIVLLESITFIKNKLLKNVTVLLTILYLLFTQFGLGPYKYVYFNELTAEEDISIYCNEVSGCGNWSTDYLGYSGKELSNKLLQLDIDEVYICEPTYAFDTFLDDKIEIFNYGSISTFPANQEFTILNLHRPMLSYDLCGFIDMDREYSCDLVDSVTTNLRGNKVNLSYIQKCIFS
jgi:hypothetical protein